LGFIPISKKHWAKALFVLLLTNPRAKARGYSFFVIPVITKPDFRGEVIPLTGNVKFWILNVEWMGIATGDGFVSLAMTKGCVLPGIGIYLLFVICVLDI
jgi:hypothetical protein